ncbi:MAG: diguanylate cyclase [Methyloprofundus sp.]|nr:diguanylate cyclase [Methyloprofundus sp.]
MKILVIDDALADRLIIRRHLLSMEHEVILAESGEQGIILFQQQDPDIVLLDVKMPEMDGYAVVKKLRAIDDGWRPILFLSSTVDTEAFAQGIYSGADDYLHKPIEKITLQAKLHAMQRIVAMRQQLLATSRALAEETQKVKKLVNEDDLTGIANRRFLNKTLDQEFRRHLREQMSLSIIMIDIDWFKDFNDHFGHLAGDDALRRCAQQMAATIKRAGEFVARYGGEEFCVVLPSTEIKKAKEVAEDLCKAVQELNIYRDDLSSYNCLTISLGVSSVVPQKSGSVESLISSADQALYQAKQAGRNQVCVETITV